MTTAPSLPDPGRRLRLRQLKEVVRLELRKALLSPRSTMLYLLAVMPIAIGCLYVIASVVFDPATAGNVARHELVFTAMYHSFILRLVLFVACLWIFMNLYRGDLIDKSLHFYYLCPVRREIVTTGKMLAGLIATAGTLMASVAATYLLLILPAGGAAFEHMLSGPGLGKLAAFEVTTIFACLGYGALFLLLGMVARNPILPGVLIWGWEQVNFFLPPLLKRVSVVYYLQGFAPLPPEDSPVKVLSESLSPWSAAIGLLAVSGLLLLVAAWRARRLEVIYAGE